MSWHPTLRVADLPVGAARIVKAGAAQIVIFHREEGLFALDNRCPHEGYPLAQGTVCGTVVTCIWHNYKFDLRDGACVLGEEAVRSYPLRVTDGVVEVDLAPSPTRTAALIRSLHDGMALHRNGRVARDLVRLLDSGVPAQRLALEIACFDSDHGEYGPSHAVAVAAELLDDLDDPEVAPYALTEAADVAGRSNARLPVRTIPAPIDPGEDHAGDQFIAAVQAEDAVRAEGLVRGAVARGWLREVEQWMLRACADHFYDFGHPLIYIPGLVALAAHGDADHAATLFGAWAYGVVNGTREEALPAWAAWRKRALPAAGPDTLDREALIDADGAHAHAALSHSDESVLAALSIAASERLLRFDTAHDANPDVQEAWLDVTHRLTTVEATRRALARGGDRRILSMTAHFVAAARPLDGARVDIPERSGDPEAFAAAVRNRDTTEALGHAAALWRNDRAAFARQLRALSRADTHQRSIFVAHDIKTVGTGLRESALLDDPRPMLGAVRLLASPIQERAVRRLVGEAVRLVRDGKPPHTLT